MFAKVSPKSHKPALKNSAILTAHHTEAALTFMLGTCSNSPGSQQSSSVIVLHDQEEAEDPEEDQEEEEASHV